MRILMVHPHDIFLTSEPWTIRIKKFAEELVKLGHEVKLAYFPLPLDRVFEKLEAKTRPGYETIPLNRSRWSFPANVVKLSRLARWAEVVHFQKCFHYAALPSILAAYLQGRPVHYDWDDWEYQIYQFWPPSVVMGWYLNALEQLLPKLADSVSVASQNLYRLCIRTGIDPDRIFEAHVGADLEEFSPARNGNRIREKYHILGPIAVYVGQLHSGQYVDLFIEAARILKGTDICFVIVGGGYDLHRYLEMSRDLTDIGKVIFTGFLQRWEVAQYVAAADVAVACFADNDLTRSKSPLKIAEYLAAGKAIVASRVGEVERMVGDAGVLVKPGDALALAEGIRQLAANPDLRQEMGLRARRRAETEYNWSVPARNLERAYRLITSRNGAA
jgi:glycosyltransferase involved in cell wall biosynthesis